MKAIADLTENEYYDLESKHNFYFSNILNVWVLGSSHFETKDELLNYLISL